MTLQREPVGSEHESSCSGGDTGIQYSEGSGKEARWLFTGARHMQGKQHRTRQGDRRDFYLISPSSPGISKPWPQIFVLPAQGSQGAERDR